MKQQFKEFLATNKSMVVEASAITGSGTGAGGRLKIDPAYSALRLANPFRTRAQQVITPSSDAGFVMKSGNALTGVANPWGYPVQSNVGTPNIQTNFWTLSLRNLSAQIPVRTAILNDITDLQVGALYFDLRLELEQLAAQSMVSNNDQNASTPLTGATNGLRGLNSYVDGVTASYGTSGTATTNGIHTIVTVNQGATAIAYNDITALVSALPAQYWMDPSTAWMMHPSTIQNLRQLKDSNNLPLFLEVGDDDGGALGYVFGFPVIPNSYIDAPGAAGRYVIYLGAWNKALHIHDHETGLELLSYDQTQPGFIQIYGQLRLASSIVDPFAVVRLKSV